MSEFDAIVAGGGPGGATAARLLAQAGLRVALFEKRPMPRNKVCAGCLSVRIEPWLAGTRFRDQIERTVHGVRFTFRGRQAFERSSVAPLAHLVTRSRFDAALVEDARRAGADVFTACPISDAREDGREVLVIAGGVEHRARWLIGADGATGVIGRALGLRNDQRKIAVALEGETKGVDPAPRGDRVEIDWGAVPHGYGWVFPKAEHLSLGVAGDKARAGHPRPYYLELIQRTGCGETEGLGYFVPYYSGALEPIRTRRAVLIGDAAALADPLLLEGIHYAVWSAHLAARALIAGDTADYEAALRREIQPELHAAHRLAFMLHALPEVGYRILTTKPRFLEEYFAVLRGESDYDRMWRMVVGAGVDRLFHPWRTLKEAWAASTPR